MIFFKLINSLFLNTQFPNQSVCHKFGFIQFGNFGICLFFASWFLTDSVTKRHDLEVMNGNIPSK